MLHFARDNPRKDVFVVVITTMSKNLKPLTNYLFQAVVPKVCFECVYLIIVINKEKLRIGYKWINIKLQPYLI